MSLLGDFFSGFVSDPDVDLDHDGINDAYAHEFDLDHDGVSHLSLIDNDGFGYDGVAFDFDGDGNYEVSASSESGVIFDLNDNGMRGLSIIDTNGDGYNETYGIDVNGDGADNIQAVDYDGDGRMDEFLVDLDGDSYADVSLYDSDGDGHLDIDINWMNMLDASLNIFSDTPADPFAGESYTVDDSDDGGMTSAYAAAPSDAEHGYLLDTNTIPETDTFKFDGDGNGILDGVAHDTNGDGIADNYYYDYHGNDGVIDTAGFDIDGDDGIDVIAYDTDQDGKFDVVGYDVNGDDLLDEYAYDQDGDGVFELEGIPGNNVPDEETVPDDEIVPTNVIVPDNGGETPDNGGETPDNGGENPDNGGETPDNGGETPDNGGETPENIDSTVQYIDIDADNDGKNDGIGIDINNDGSIDAYKEDINKDGQADFALFDLDHNGSLDAYTMDIDYDRKADVLAVDYNGDGEYEETLDISNDNLSVEDMVNNYIVNNTDNGGEIPDNGGETPDNGEETPDNNNIPDDGYQTHDIDHDRNMTELIKDGDREWDMGGNGIKTFVDSDKDGKNDIMIHEYDSDGDGYFDTTIQYYDTDGDGDVDQIIRTEVIDTDGDGISDTYMESIDANNDGTFEAVRVYDYDDNTGDKDFITIYNDIDASEYDADSSEPMYYNDIKTFDPDSADPDKVIGNPEEAMELWESQGQTGRCGIFAQKFIIEQYTGQEVDIEELVQKATENGWFWEIPDENNPEDLTNCSGTSLDNANKLLNLYGVPSEITYNNEFSDIVEALQSGKHVLVGIDADELWSGEQDDIFSPADGPNHAVDVIGVDYTDPENPMVILNDSGHWDASKGQGELVPLDTFLDAWDDSNNHMVVAG